MKNKKQIDVSSNPAPWIFLGGTILFLCTGMIWFFIVGLLFAYNI